TASVGVVRVVERLMEIAHEMDEETEGFGSLVWRRPWVAEHLPVVLDCGNDAPAVRAMPRGDVGLLAQGNVHVVKPVGIVPVVPDIVCPHRGVGEALSL